VQQPPSTFSFLKQEHNGLPLRFDFFNFLVFLVFEDNSFFFKVASGSQQGTFFLQPGPCKPFPGIELNSSTVLVSNPSFRALSRMPVAIGCSELAFEGSCEA